MKRKKNPKKKKKYDFKRILFILFLILAIFSIFGRLLSGINDNGFISNNSVASTINQYDNSSYNPNAPKNNLSSPNYEVNGLCDDVIDGDTINVEGVGRIRLVGIDTPERGEQGYMEATEYVRSKCLGKTVYLDIDDAENRDKYGRVLAIVYVDGLNINQELLKLGYAKILYILPSEFEKGLGVK